MAKTTRSKAEALAAVGDNTAQYEQAVKDASWATTRSMKLELKSTADLGRSKREAVDARRYKVTSLLFEAP